MAAILNFRLNGTSSEVAWCAIEMAAPENMGIAAGISYLGGIDPEIAWG